MTYSPTDPNNSNKSTPVRMRRELEKQQARLERLAFSDQATQQTANAAPLAQRQPWSPLLGRKRAG